MGLTSIFEIAGSALSAQSQRLNVSASNMANADSAIGPDGLPYRAKQVVFQVTPLKYSTYQHSEIGGVQVAGVIDDPSAMKLVYNPNHPLADPQGYVTMPNVDPIAETINSISASRSYQANVEVINTARALMQKTLAIGQ